MLTGGLLWLIGVPIPVLILIWFFFLRGRYRPPPAANLRDANPRDHRITARPRTRTSRGARTPRSSSRQNCACLYRAGMRTALAALTLVMAAGAALAQQQPPTVPELLTAEAKAALGCEGSGDPAVIREQCRLRDRLSGRLAQAGYCWGRKGQSDEKKDWHACQPDSIFEDDIEAVQR